MKKSSGVKDLICWSCLLITCLAQTESMTVNEASRRPPEKESERRVKLPDKTVRQPTFVRRGALPFKRKISREQKILLKPNAADLSRYAAFLQQPRTGLIKLFPDLGCEGNANIVRADAECLNSIPMSAFYSFREKEYTTDFLSDIRLENDILITDGILTQGILVALGDIALENISLTSDGLDFLTEYKPETQSEKALKHTFQLIKGINSDGYLYRKTLPAKENTTYALRVIAYRGSVLQTFRGMLFNMLAGDDRADIIVAFRMLKKDEKTGSFTLLWKELSRKGAPKIIFPKKSKKRS